MRRRVLKIAPNRASDYLPGQREAARVVSAACAAIENMRVER